MRAPIHFERDISLQVIFNFDKEGVTAVRLRCKEFAACFDILGFKPFFRRKENEWQSQLLKQLYVQYRVILFLSETFPSWSPSFNEFLCSSARVPWGFDIHIDRGFECNFVECEFFRAAGSGSD